MTRSWCYSQSTNSCTNSIVTVECRKLISPTSLRWLPIEACLSQISSEPVKRFWGRTGLNYRHILQRMHKSKINVVNAVGKWKPYWKRMLRHQIVPNAKRWKMKCHTATFSEKKLLKHWIRIFCTLQWYAELVLFPVIKINNSLKHDCRTSGKWHSVWSTHVLSRSSQFCLPYQSRLFNADKNSPHCSAGSPTQLHMASFIVW
jgi:hypothetical protein